MTDRQDRESLGEHLVKQDLITREELDEARQREQKSGIPWFRWLLQSKKVDFGVMNFLKYEYHPRSLREKHQSLGRALVELKAITKEQLQEALAEQQRNGRLLGNILLDRGLVTRRTIALALSRQHGLEFEEIEEAISDPKAIEVLPESMARRNNMIPLHLEGDRLTVLITDPQIRHQLEDVGVLLGKRVHPVMTSCDNIQEEITKRYEAVVPKHGHGLFRKKEQVVKAPKEPFVLQEAAQRQQQEKTKQEDRETSRKGTQKAKGKKEETVETTPRRQEQGAEKKRFEEIAREASGAPVMKLVSTIVEGAANSGATDIHLDPQEPEMRVRYRIDGILHDVMSIPGDIENAVISRVKIMSDLDITETRRPQDGHISLTVGDREFDIRVATLPTFLGERVVLRLLDQSSVLQGIKDLGLESEDEKKLTQLIQQPYGMILVTGPTGSGKTTTLYAALNQKNVITESIVTLEDPVEYQLSGINQVQIDPDIDLSFANTLRASLRQDIDVLLVGEIRDPETAHIAIRAAMTGHLVFSTLHTNDAPEAISTLRNMGVPSYLIASALTGIVGQRLVRTICDNCKESYSPTKTLLKSLRLPENTGKLYRGTGCEVCYHTGNKGRTGIFEVLEVTPQVRKMIADDMPIDNIAKTVKLKTMADRARQKVKNGLITAEEFLRVIRT
jgi:type IV pilus assembly protein PilB